MSAITTRTQPCGEHDREEIAVDDAHAERESLTVDGLITHVLGRARRRAEAINEPNAARATLYVAYSFADELASSNESFDRQQFIRQMMGHAASPGAGSTD